MKHFIITYMASVLCCAAENRMSTELANSIMAAADKSFPEFVSAATAVEIPPLPLPKNGGASLPIDDVSALVWRRLSAERVIVTPANKVEKMELMHAMGKMRSWLLKHDSYANLVFASFIHESVIMSTLNALAEGVINPAEARALIDALTPDITTTSMLAMIQQTLPHSKALEKLSNIDTSQLSLKMISDDLTGEFSEKGVRKIADLAEKERPASLSVIVVTLSYIKNLAPYLIEFAKKGGDLNLQDSQFTDEFDRLIPEAINVTEPVSREKISAFHFDMLMNRVREWKLKY